MKHPLNIPSMDFTFTEKVIQTFIRHEVQYNGFKGGLISLSGGLDSSLASVLAHTALNGNIALLYMPYGKNPSAFKDVSTLAEMIDTPLEVFDIQAITDQICTERSIRDPKRKGNIMARLRMNILFDQSARDQLMVIGGSNKTELMIGYSTWYGDSAAGIMPLGDLYKTQVKGLAQHCHLPENIISKPPSAELWEGQTDEDEIGLPYEKLDAILFYWLDQRHSPQQLVQMGFDLEAVEKVVKITRKALYKQKKPTICKVSDRTIGIDYRLCKETMQLGSLDL